jgi:hypothetical protein
MSGGAVTDPLGRLLFWSNINPYGRFRLDMDTRLDLSSKRPRGATPEVSAVAKGSYPRPKKGIPERTKTELAT